MYPGLQSVTQGFSTDTELQTVHETNRALKRRLMESERSAQILLEERDAATMKVTAIEEQLAAFSRELASLSQENNAIRDENSVLIAQIATIEDQLRANKVDTNVIATAVARATDMALNGGVSVTDLREQLSSAQRELESRQQQVVSLQQKLESTEKESIETQAKMKVLEAQLSVVPPRLSQRASKRLEAALVSAHEILGYDEDLTEIMGDQAETVAAVTEALRGLTRLASQPQTTERQEQAGLTREQEIELRKQMDDLVNRTEQIVTSMSEELKAAQDGRDAYALRLKEALEQLETSETEREHVMKAFTEAQSRINMCREENETLIEQARLDAQDHADHVAELEQQISELKKKSSATDLTLRDLGEEEDKVTQQRLHRAEEEAAALQVQLKAANDEVARIRAEYGDLQTRYDALYQTQVGASGLLSQSIVGGPSEAEHDAEFQMLRLRAEQAEEQAAAARDEAARLHKQLEDAESERSALMKQVEAMRNSLTQLTLVASRPQIEIEAELAETTTDGAADRTATQQPCDEAPEEANELALVRVDECGIDFYELLQEIAAYYQFLLTGRFYAFCDRNDSPTYLSADEALAARQTEYRITLEGEWDTFFSPSSLALHLTPLDENGDAAGDGSYYILKTGGTVVAQFVQPQLQPSVITLMSDTEGPLHLITNDWMGLRTGLIVLLAVIDESLTTDLTATLVGSLVQSKLEPPQQELHSSGVLEGDILIDSLDSVHTS